MSVVSYWYVGVLVMGLQLNRKLEINNNRKR